ncbi:hypothetical protein ADUPG1_000124 [Aduncisulcus paluster]|uniref:CST complex subunit CTC1 n=1 Tax=Aduncisulcus paluster TaxID=2918883 RepID=A0ABQ5K531_9EUKA|nr:hypothetical protein ADUPG1_000124 [Aduncisulcus paluster]
MPFEYGMKQYSLKDGKVSAIDDTILSCSPAYSPSIEISAILQDGRCLIALRNGVYTIPFPSLSQIPAFPHEPSMEADALQQVEMEIQKKKYELIQSWHDPFCVCELVSYGLLRVADSSFFKCGVDVFAGNNHIYALPCGCNRAVKLELSDNGRPISLARNCSLALTLIDGVDSMNDDAQCLKVYIASQSSLFSFYLPSIKTLKAAILSASSSQLPESPFELSQPSISGIPCFHSRVFEEVRVYSCPIPHCVFLEGKVSGCQSSQYSRNFEDTIDQNIDIFSRIHCIEKRKEEIDKTISNAKNEIIVHILKDTLSSSFFEKEKAVSKVGDLKHIHQSKTLFDDHIDCVSLLPIQANIIDASFIFHSPKSKTSDLCHKKDEMKHKEEEEEEESELCCLLLYRKNFELTKAHKLIFPADLSSLSPFIQLSDCVDYDYLARITHMEQWECDDFGDEHAGFLPLDDHSMSRILSCFSMGCSKALKKIFYPCETPEKYLIKFGIVKAESDKEPQFRKEKELKDEDKSELAAIPGGFGLGGPVGFPSVFGFGGTGLGLGGGSFFGKSSKSIHVPEAFRTKDFIELTWEELWKFIGAPLVFGSSKYPNLFASLGTMCGYDIDRICGEPIIGIHSKMISSGCSISNCDASWIGIPTFACKPGTLSAVLLDSSSVNSFSEYQTTFQWSPQATKCIYPEGIIIGEDLDTLGLKIEDKRSVLVVNPESTSSSFGPSEMKIDNVRPGAWKLQLLYNESDGSLQTCQLSHSSTIDSAFALETRLSCSECTRENSRNPPDSITPSTTSQDWKFVGTASVGQNVGFFVQSCYHDLDKLVQIIRDPNPDALSGQGLSQLVFDKSPRDFTHASISGSIHLDRVSYLPGGCILQRTASVGQNVGFFVQSCYHDLDKLVQIIRDPNPDALSGQGLSQLVFDKSPRDFTHASISGSIHLDRLSHSSTIDSAFALETRLSCSECTRENSRNPPDSITPSTTSQDWKFVGTASVGQNVGFFVQSCYHDLDKLVQIIRDPNPDALSGQGLSQLVFDKSPRDFTHASISGSIHLDRLSHSSTIDSAFALETRLSCSECTRENSRNPPDSITPSTTSQDWKFVGTASVGQNVGFFVQSCYHDLDKLVQIIRDPNPDALSGQGLSQLVFDKSPRDFTHASISGSIHLDRVSYLPGGCILQSGLFEDEPQRSRAYPLFIQISPGTEDIVCIRIQDY